MLKIISTYIVYQLSNINKTQQHVNLLAKNTVTPHPFIFFFLVGRGGLDFYNQTPTMRKIVFWRSWVMTYKTQGERSNLNTFKMKKKKLTTWTWFAKHVIIMRPTSSNLLLKDIESLFRFRPTIFWPALNILLMSTYLITLGHLDLQSSSKIIFKNMLS